MHNIVSRRDWLAHNTAMLMAVSPPHRSPVMRGCTLAHNRGGTAMAARIAAHAERVDAGPLQELALRAVEVARAAGARYADARLTRTVGHKYEWQQGKVEFRIDTEVQGVGVRALVDGCWGFAAAPFWSSQAVVRLARDAVAQATVNAKASAAKWRANASWIVDLEPVPVVTGTWATPVVIDPFTIPIEEKIDHLILFMAVAERYNLYCPEIFHSNLTFMRQERVVATSDGALVTQTIYESGGVMQVKSWKYGPNSPSLFVQGLVPAGRGWELILDAKIPGQLEQMPAKMDEVVARRGKPSTVGRYTLVCDGATMAALLGATLGVATQLDRALGYEANARGTSFIDDPLAMVGHYQVASPHVTVTANRSAPTQLATVKWDDEGVVPDPFTLVKDGVLVDFQTTREQAAWLAPYYAKHGRPVRSHGCAAAEDALVTTMQMMPNLALEPGPAAMRLGELVADVKEGILITEGSASSDFQARNGLLWGSMQEIGNGRLGRSLSGGAIQFDSIDLWKHVAAVGGLATTCVIAAPQDPNWPYFLRGGHGVHKGEPSQTTSYSVQAVAATITNQPLIDPERKA